MTDEPNSPSPSRPVEGYRYHGNQPSRHEEGRRSSSHQENRRQIVEGPITHTDSIRNPSVSSGAAAGGAAAGTVPQYRENKKKCTLHASHDPL